MSWVDKQLLATRFDRRAASYDEATPVQAAMGDELLQRALERIGATPVARILELGCGTGRLTRKLINAFPDARITAVDLSARMTAIAATRCPGVETLVADAEDFIQQAAPGFDLIISNATAQWFSDPAASIRACLRLLAPGGHLALSTFGDQTFRELNEAFRLAYREHGLPDARHASPLPSADYWRTRFPNLDIHHAPRSRTFPDVPTFLRSLQQAGVTHAATNRTVLSRNLLQSMTRHYAANFSTSGSPSVAATYDIIFLHGASPPRRDIQSISSVSH
jgi:malonyl-CoA O-methyltransferase